MRGRPTSTSSWRSPGWPESASAHAGCTSTRCRSSPSSICRANARRGQRAPLVLLAGRDRRHVVREDQDARRRRAPRWRRPPRPTSGSRRCRGCAAAASRRRGPCESRCAPAHLHRRPVRRGSRTARVSPASTTDAPSCSIAEADRRRRPAGGRWAPRGSRTPSRLPHHAVGVLVHLDARRTGDVGVVGDAGSRCRDRTRRSVASTTSAVPGGPMIGSGAGSGSNVVIHRVMITSPRSAM